MTTLMDEMKPSWQYLLGEEWINCSAENSELLSNRRENPTLEEIILKNEKGIIWGIPEKNQMKFRPQNGCIHGAQNTAIRIGINETDSAIHVVEYINLDNDVESHIMIPPKIQRLLEEHPDNGESLNLRVGTDCLVYKKGNIYMKTAGNTLVRCRYGISDLSHSQFKEITRARFSWVFQGPFRINRMHTAVRETGLTLPDCQKLVLYDLFDRVFDPDDAEATEYGSFQFQDFLISRGKIELATKLMDTYHSIPDEEWQPFSLVQNAKIEAHRAKKSLGTTLTVGGVIYMLVFESGAGSSGSNPILIRPSRYNKILTSIEEKFKEDCLRDLFTALVEFEVNPIEFVHSAYAEEVLTDDQKKKIVPLLHKVQHPQHYMGTILQNLLPSLLEKFKECNIKMSTEENINEKKLCPRIRQTLYEGLSVPQTSCYTFEEMIYFIHSQQSWVVPKVDISIRHCDICLESDRPCVLTHCGSSGACLKCWADSLVENNFKCMFCRQKVVSGSLKISIDKDNPECKENQGEQTTKENADLRRSKRRKIAHKK